MKVGIDSYCFHRLFGEVYPHQHKVDPAITTEDFIDFASSVGADGVSLESCFLEATDADTLGKIKAMLDHRGLDRVYAWGHPDGLEGGGNPDAFASLLEHIGHARAIGAEVMRVVGSSLSFRFEPHQPQLDRLARMLQEAAQVAGEQGVVLAIENHIDYNSDEILWLLKEVDSPHLGVNFDSGNFLRMLDDPVGAMEKLAPYVRATHIKDLLPVPGVPADEWYFFSCVPTGRGLVDNQRIAQILKDHGYTGTLAVESDSLHPDYAFQEEVLVSRSVQELKCIADRVR